MKAKSNKIIIGGIITLASLKASACYYSGNDNNIVMQSLNCTEFDALDSSMPTLNNSVTSVRLLTFNSSAPTFNSNVSSTHFYSYDSAAAIYNGPVQVSDSFYIYGSSRPTFNNSVTASGFYGISIYQSSTPIFNGEVTTGRMDIMNTSAPIFNGGVTTGQMDIMDTSTPTFNNSSLSVGTLSVSGDSVPVFNAPVIASGRIDISGNSKAVFNSDLTTPLLRMINGSSSPVFEEAVNAQATTITSSAAPIFKKNITSTAGIIIKDLSVPIFYGNVLSDINISGTPTITFSSNTEVQNISFIDAAEPLFKGTITGTSINLTPATEAKFSDGLILNTPAITSINKTGKMTFLGAATITKDLGAADKWLEEIKFVTSGDINSDIHLSKNIYSDKLSFNKSNIILSNNIALQTGENSLDITDGVIDLGLNTMTLSGKSIVTGGLTFKTQFTELGGTGGNIVVSGANSVFDFSNATPVKIILTCDSPLPPIGQFYEYKLLSVAEDGGSILPAQGIEFIDNDNNILLEWEYNPETYTLKSKFIPEVLAPSVGNAGGNSNTVEIAKVLATSTDGAAFNLLSNVGRLGSDALRIEALQRLQPINNDTEVIATATDNTLNDLDNRISAQIQPNLFAEGSTPTGLAAGDAARNYGVWMSPFYSKTFQARSGSGLKYNSKTFGATIGVDTAINEQLMIGLAMTPMRTDIRYSNVKGNDKGKVNSLIFSLYSYKEFASNNWFINGVLCGGNNKVSGEERRILTRNITEIAKSNYKVKSFSGQFSAGYNYKLRDNIIITPSGGLGYYWIDGAKYKETGASINNLTIKKGTSYIAEATIGTQIAFKRKIKETHITPEIYAYITYDFKKRGSKIDARLDGLASPLPVNTAKRNPLFLNLGTQINAESSSKQFEYGIACDLELGKKYLTYGGSLKLRVLL